MTPAWSGAAFARIAELVRERTGLIFPEARVRDIEAIIRRTVARRRFHDENALLTALRDDEREREAFVAELTIGESYFQRDPAQFDVLRRTILPGLLAARSGDRAVRVWSAGCAAGEEPYTVAMLFEEMGAADRCDIVGTDIARARLEDAQRGIYSTWQLRGMPDSVRGKFFAARGRYFELTPRIRHRVDFRYLNLAEDSFPSLATGIWGMDVILCRNVLIYFDAETVERVARRLIASLSEDGWLLLGGSDPPIGEIIECDVVVTDAGLVYRRRRAADEHDTRRQHAAAAPIEPPRVEEDEPSARSEWTLPTPALDEPSSADASDPVSAPAVVQADADPAILAAYARRDFGRVHELASGATRNGKLGCAGWVAWIRGLANEGRLDEAATVLTSALEQHGPAAELLYLHAVLLLQSGRAPDAAAASRRALYMDPELVVAHLTLAEAQRRVGAHDAARRSLNNAAVLLGRLRPNAIVAASDGENAGRLAELVRMKLKLLGEPAKGTA